MATKNLYNTQTAAEFLAQELSNKTVEQWALWLRNNRNHARPATYRIPAQQIGRGAFYAQEELVAFIEFEKSRRVGAIKLSGKAAQALRAFGAGEQGGTAQGRLWRGASVNLLTTPKSEIKVQLIINEPLMVMLLSLEQAEAFESEMRDVVSAAKRIQQSEAGRGTSNDYEVVSDNVDALVIRKPSRSQK